jgi:serine/threonine protein kinase
MTLERGAFLHNRYRILEILGQGGMGSIYRAIDENLGVEVAVKENLFTTDEYARQFRREAIILANLRHQNLPRVSDHFVIDGQGQYLVMDYIEGEDLRERMDRSGVVPENEILVIGAAICDALTYMHTRKPPVLHRDIKPGNVKITPQGEIFLVDFGLAKVVQAGQQTSTGARAMTPGYSPPEQYGAARTDHRSDIYSLGATMYAALVGVIPEDSLARTMEQTELTPVRKRNPKISRRTAAAIEKALEVHPDDRFQTADEFKQALSLDRSTTIRRMVETGTITPHSTMEPISYSPAEILESHEESEPPPEIDSHPLPLPVSRTLEQSESQPPEPVKKRRGRGCLWVIGLMFVLVLLLFLVYTFNPAIAMPALNQATNQVTWLLDQAGISTDFLAGISFGQATDTPVPGPQAATLSPTFELTQTPEPTFTLTASLQATTTSTTLPTDALTPSDTPIPSETPNPSATPMGGGYGQIAFASDRTGLAQIWLINLDGTNLHQITESPWGACQPDWSPDGTRLVYTAPCEVNRETYRGSGLLLINADGTNPVSLPVQGIGDYDPAWSPDGKKIAFTSLRTNGRPRIMVMDLETGEVISLSEDNNWDAQPAWSSDGTKIIFVSTRNGPYQIWIMDTDGSNQNRFSVSKDLKNTNPTLSPEGGLLVFTQSAGEGSIPHLRGVPFPDGAEEEYDVYPFSGAIPMRDADFSIDGFWIAFESWPNGVLHDIFFMAPNGAGFTQLTTHPALDFDPAWRPIAVP